MFSDSLGFWGVLGIVLVVVIASLFFVYWHRRKKEPSPAPHQSDVDTILNSIQAIDGTSGSILLAAGQRRDLPVTIPIRLAIQMSQKGPCLLIDLDSRRDAIAKAFAIDSSKIDVNLKLTPVTTDFENLSVWPARYFELLRHMNLRGLLEFADKKYKTILLYAPTLTTLVDRKQIAACSKQAIVFNGKDSKDPQLYQLLHTSRCNILHEA